MWRVRERSGEEEVERVLNRWEGVVDESSVREVSDFRGRKSVWEGVRRG